MKKIFVFCTLVFLMFLTGCEKNNNVISSITKKVESSESYKLKGELEIINNETSYLYDVESYSLKGEMFKVNLKNKINNHYEVFNKQIRSCKYSDFCILLDRGSAFNTYKKVFDYLGIPLHI